MLKITNPATGEVIKEVPTDKTPSITEKFQRAQAFQPEWAATPLEKRMEMIRKFRAMLETDKEELARILTAEVGKPIAQSRNEVGGTLARIDYFLEKTPVLLKNETVFKEGNMEEVIGHEPLGVIANISAWNYPFFVGSNVFIPALLTGNCVLYKPSEFATLTGLAIAERLHKAGVPAAAFQTIVGDGSVGGELLKNPVNGVFFTGSYPTGKRIAEAVAGRMIKVQLELGGKDPAYVCEDVDVTAAAEGLADGAFYNNGQSCCAVERVYVHASVYDRFVEHFVKTVQGFVVGNPSDDKTYIGALTRGAQLSVLKNQVADAVAKGAKLHVGGKKMEMGKGHYFEPTVFSNVNHKMELMREESFGPVIGIQKVSGDEEAVAMMNDTEYGLTAGVFTKDKARAAKILSRVNAGSVYWNCCDRVSPRLPWSGRGHSGIGSTLSTYGILTFLQPKAWHLRG
jgi:acyl-CoA reductase-like NAD-dependent aldehyde dehydrogenase